jgi:hypothetical protein
MDKNSWFKLWSYYLDYKKKIILLNEKIQKGKHYEKKTSKLIRNPDFPSELSETLVLFCYEKLYEVKMKWEKGADLWNNNKKFEIKAFVSGPISFSPKLNFESIFFFRCKAI